MISEESLASNICGVNDINLRHLESVFGGIVFSRGNLIILDNASEEKREGFRKLVGSLESLAAQGHPIHPDLIFNSIERVSASEAVISIPHGESVFPRTNSQSRMVVAVRQNSVTLAIGPSGTGKTFLAVALGLADVLGKKKRKLILTRPVVEAGENLGFLPGDLSQKISPYLRPLYDAMEDLVPYEVVQRLEEMRQLEIAPLAYMRGRSLRNSFIILDEAQNTTKGQMKMFLTRLGEGTKAVVMGDVSQVDLPRREQSGLLEAQELLQGVQDISIINFDKTEVIRSALVRHIVEAYEKS